MISRSTACLAAVGLVKAAVHAGLLLPVHGTAHKGCGDAEHSQMVHLVLNERDERGHHNRDALGEQRWQLIA